MHIESPTTVSPTCASEDFPAHPLEQRLNRPAHATQASDPGFEAFYRQLLALSGTGEKEILLFIANYRSSDEGALDYRTIGEQMTVVGQALSRLKEEGLEGSEQHKELRGVMGRLFGTSLFINQYMQDIFNPEWDEDSRETADW
ncbi:hypothetical protein AWM79_23010 [Pseudomonas agarici]|uniref:Uncharacterized protein n=1 Tax=Pseudomonas agarici TaxID=46677 RepID=A0A0X1T7A7_PSEAA|nr:hypothetical protein [Pseudomonas agarici]AMB87988.1 hypothetical protein AWM79_23010 [Pseudomonas agarici]